MVNTREKYNTSEDFRPEGTTANPDLIYSDGINAYNNLHARLSEIEDLPYDEEGRHLNLRECLNRPDIAEVIRKAVGWGLIRPKREEYPLPDGRSINFILTEWGEPVTEDEMTGILASVLNNTNLSRYLIERLRAAGFYTVAALANAGIYWDITYSPIRKLLRNELNMKRKTIKRLVQVLQEVAEVYPFKTTCYFNEEIIKEVIRRTQENEAK